MNGIKLVGTGSYLPDLKVTNEMFSKVVETNDEWISTRTGIKTRNFVSDDTDTTMAVKAAAAAIKNSGIDKQDIGVVLVATFTSEYMIPSVACVLQKELGLPEEILGFDLNAACSGFVYAIHTAKSLLKSSQKKYALVVGSEVLSKILDYTDRSTCVLFGDGAGAAVISLADAPYGFVSGAEGTTEIIECDGIQHPGSPFTKPQGENKHLVKMNGREVYRFAVEKFCKCAKELSQQTGVAIEDVDYFVCHQANYRILQAASKKLGVSMDKFFANLDHCGNTSAASIPIALDEMMQEGLLKPGMQIMCVGFGGGLTYGGIFMKL